MAAAVVEEIVTTKNRAVGILDAIDALLGLAPGDDQLGMTEAEQSDDEEGGGLLHQAIQMVLLGGGDKEGGSLLDQAMLTFLMGGEDGNGVIPRLDRLTLAMEVAQANIQTNFENILGNSNAISVLQKDVRAIQGDIKVLRTEIAAVKNRPCNCGGQDTADVLTGKDGPN
jgi:hypothetical protein